MYTVYVHTTPDNKKYVGVTSRPVSRRWGNGSGYSTNSTFKEAISRYGWNNIKHEILSTCENREEAMALEKHYVESYKANDKQFGYNLTSGGADAEATLNARAKYAEEVYEWIKDIPLEVPEAPAPVDYPNGASAIVIASRGTTVNFREQPSVETGEIIERIPIGSTVTVYRKDQIWCEVEYQGNRGYMMTEFLDITEPPDSMPDAQPDETDDTQDTILVQREALVAIRNTINVLLGE